MILYDICLHLQAYLTAFRFMILDDNNRSRPLTHLMLARARRVTRHPPYTQLDLAHCGLILDPLTRLYTTWAAYRTITPYSSSRAFSQSRASGFSRPRFERRFLRLPDVPRASTAYTIASSTISRRRWRGGLAKEVVMAVAETEMAMEAGAGEGDGEGGDGW